MAARGSIAKSVVGKKIAEAFGADYVGETGGKHYVWAIENGERVQIAIAMTCPKTPIGEVPAKAEDFNWGDDNGTQESATAYKPAEITDDERERVADLMKKLGL